MKHTQNARTGRGRRLLPRMALLTAALALPLVGCDTSEILEVQDPDIAVPETLTGEGGRAALFAGAILDFGIAYSGAAAGGGSTEGVVMIGGLMTDEWVHSGTFPTRTPVDQRNIDIRNGTLLGVFSNMQRARVAASNAIDVLEEAATDAPDSRVPLLRNLNGYTYLFFAENYCSGVPFSEAPPTGEFEFGEQVTTTEMLNLAIQRFDAALAGATAAGVDSLASLARVGKARALLDLGEYAQAAGVAADVPPDFVYVVQHSANTSRQENGVYALNTLFERWSIPNDEGGSGDPFLDSPTDDGEGLSFLAAMDPRVPYQRTFFVEEGDTVFDVGFDGSTPQYNLLGYPAYGISLDRGASVPLASGIEAQLIEAEAAFQTSPDAALEILNELRATSDLELEPLAGPATVDLLFRERAFWLYATAHRLPDLRRLIVQYGQSPANVFPSGEYFKGGVYGSQTAFPIPFEEQNNPLFAECLAPDILG